MKVPIRVLRRLLAAFTWSSRDREMDQEMAFHLQSLKREYLGTGMSESEAERAARRRFGSIVRLKEQGHDIRSARVFEDIVRDARHAGRGVRRSPGFAFAVVLTLAIGIGGNTAIFSVVDQLLLRPLPYPDGERLVTITESALPKPGGREFIPRIGVSPANWLDWQRESRTLDAVALWRTATATLTGTGEPQRLNGQFVSAEFFPLLGVNPLLGRAVEEQDDRPNAPPVILISHDLWQRQFGGDRSVVGRIVQLDEQPVEIVGVMPPGFRFIYQDTDYWSAGRLDRSANWRAIAGRFGNAVARVRPGVTLDAARSEMETIARRLAEMHIFNRDTSVTFVSLREELTGQVERSLLVLYAAVVVLLTIACFNVVNLLLARAASRQREIAIRTSLGAGRLAIVRQLVVESCLLAVIGGALGIALARWSLDALVAFAPPDLLRVPALSVDQRVLFYALGLSALTGLLVGLVPAFSQARRSIALQIRQTSANITHSPRVRQALVICQVAMTVVLLCGAGLLLRTVVALNRTSHGFDKQDVLTMTVNLPTPRYAGRSVAFFDEALEALRALPTVEAAGAGDRLPVLGTPMGTLFHRLGTPQVPMNEAPSTMVRIVTPGYFRTLHVPLLRGRDFTESDNAPGVTSGFIVNAAFVREFLAELDPLTVSLSVVMRAENPYRPIIGVVGDVSEGSVRGATRPIVYYNLAQLPGPAMTLLVRTRQPAAVAPRAIDTLHTLDANLAVSRVQTLEDVFADSIARERLNALVSGSFALGGLLLASLGLYGLLAFLVAERTKEFGIKIALGAQGDGLVRSVVGGGFRLVGIGAAIGVAASLLLSRSVGALLFGVTPYDLPTYVVVLGLIAAVAAWASYVPARRAARVEPLVALRQE